MEEDAEHTPNVLITGPSAPCEMHLVRDRVKQHKFSDGPWLVLNHEAYDDHPILIIQ